MDHQSEVSKGTRAILDATWQVYAGVGEQDAPDKGRERVYLRLKRIMDFTIATVLFVLCLPIMFVAALAVKLDSKGPVIFAQERVGYDPATGEPRLIKVYKFRTMKVNSDEAIHRDYVTGLIKNNVGVQEKGLSLKMVFDPRVTKVGRLLRKSSLDELPQLANVIKGDMSLVGPRPALPYEVAAYEEWHRLRLGALPGITGWWQVMGRNRVSFDDMVRMDIYYINHRSLGLDLKLLFLTPVAVVSGKGAG